MAHVKKPIPDSLSAIQDAIDTILRQHGPFLSVANAARKTNVPIATISDAVRHGRVQSLRLFDKAVVRLKDVEDYVSHGNNQKTTRTLADLFAENAEEMTEDLPKDFSVNMNHYLYPPIDSSGE